MHNSNKSFRLLASPTLQTLNTLAEASAAEALVALIARNNQGLWEIRDCFASLRSWSGQFPAPRHFLGVRDARYCEALAALLLESRRHFQRVRRSFAPGWHRIAFASFSAPRVGRGRSRL